MSRPVNGHGEVSGRPDHPAWSELVTHVESQSGKNPLAADLSAARAADAQLRMIIDTIPVLAWCNLPDSSNEFLNQRWQDYTGLSRQEACGWEWQAAFHPDDIGALMDRWCA